MKNEKVANYIGWAVMIFIADYWGFEPYYTDVAAKILDTKQQPEIIIASRFEEEAHKMHSLIGLSGRIDEANIFAQKILSGEFPEPLKQTQVQADGTATETHFNGAHSAI